MRKVWLVAVLVVTVIAFGCGAGGGAKATAKKILEAGKTGDADVILDHLDLKGMYEAQVPEGMREQMKYEDFEKKMREGIKKNVKKNPDLEYEIISVEEEGDTATVTVKTKMNKDAEWEEAKVPLKKIDGKWKITMEGLAAIGGGE